VAQLGRPDHLAAAVAAAYHATWFTQQHDESVSLFSKGVLPGDPEADLLFTIVILQALDAIHHRLVEAGLVDPTSNAPAERAFSAHVDVIPDMPADISYVDDSVVLVEDAAERNCQTIGRTCVITQTTFEEFGLPVNYAPGKTEVVVGFVGAGSRAARLELVFEQQGRIQFEHAGGTLHILVSQVYKHLGTFVAAG